jgi:predicted  nucleic acid-binding Zn-ribbon protein
MSVDLELLIAARNYAIKIETEFAKARKQWKERFQNLDDELQGLYREQTELKESINNINMAYNKVVKEFNAVVGD